MATRQGSSDDGTSESYVVLQTRKAEPKRKRQRFGGADGVEACSYQWHRWDNEQAARRREVGIEVPGRVDPFRYCPNCDAVNIIWRDHTVCRRCGYGTAYFNSWDDGENPMPDPRSQLRRLLENFTSEHPT